MKLHAHHVATLHRPGEWSGIVRYANGFFHQRSAVAVRVVHERLLRQSRQQPRCDSQPRSSSIPRAAPCASPGNARSIRAIAPRPATPLASVLPSNSHCSPTQMPRNGTPRRDRTRAPHPSIPVSSQTRRRRKVPHSRKHYTLRRAHHGRSSVTLAAHQAP